MLLIAFYSYKPYVETKNDDKNSTFIHSPAPTSANILTGYHHQSGTAGSQPAGDNNLQCREGLGRT